VRINSTKILLAKIMSPVGFGKALFWLKTAIFNNNFIQAVNYHGTSYESANNFEKQLRTYTLYFSPVSRADLDKFFETGKWWKSKPGLIISFDDGCKSNYDVAAPLLEKYGFGGWFFVPAGYIECAPEQQSKYAIKHNLYRENDAEDGRQAMSWNELIELKSRGHIVGCHTKTHYRCVASASKEKLEEEIVTAKLILEKKLQDKVDIFCWVGGEENTYSSLAANIIKEAEYKYSFMTNTAPITPNTSKLQLQRPNIESDWPLSVVWFQLSGIMDVLYTKKRARINKITNTFFS